MSKIGMRPIAVSKAKVSIDGQHLVKIANEKGSWEHVLPDVLTASYENGFLKIFPIDRASRDKDQGALWGLHRALVAGKIKGAEEGFVSTVRIVGIGFKAAVVADKLVLTLGFSHKVELPLDKDISIEIDKIGQLMTLRSTDKFKLGNFCAKIRTYREPEPYKGTGIYVNDETIIRKAGKSKA